MVSIYEVVAEDILTDVWQAKIVASNTLCLGQLGDKNICLSDRVRAPDLLVLFQDRWIGVFDFAVRPSAFDGEQGGYGGLAQRQSGSISLGHG